MFTMNYSANVCSTHLVWWNTDQVVEEWGKKKRVPYSVYIKVQVRNDLLDKKLSKEDYVFHTFADKVAVDKQSTQFVTLCIRVLV